MSQKLPRSNKNKENTLSKLITRGVRKEKNDKTKTYNLSKSQWTRGIKRSFNTALTLEFYF